MFANLTLPELMQRLPGYFVPERAAGVNAKVLFHLTGNQGGDWTVTFRDQACSVNSMAEPDPDLILTADAQDCLDILVGKLDEMKAFMMGRLKLKGDIKLAMKLASFFQFVP